MATLVPIESRTRRIRAFSRVAVDVTLANGHAALPPFRSPLVIQVHEAGWLERATSETLEEAFVEHLQTNTKKNVAAADLVITPSLSSAEDVARGYGIDRARVHAVPHGVDPVFRAGLAGGRELVARAHDAEPGPYVLFAGAFHPRKNIAALRAAMRILFSEGFSHKLVLAGGPATDRSDADELERAALAQLADHPGRIVGVKHPTDAELAALMAGADAFCLPSLYEGFGLTALEAMACGAPTVVSNRGPLPEIAGDAAIQSPPDAPDLADALRGILGDPVRAEALGRAAALRAQQFTWERTAAGWLAVLERAAVAAQGNQPPATNPR